MNKPNILQGMQQEDLEYIRRLPTAVILDLKEHIEQFHEKTAQMNEYEWCIDEMLDLILSYITVRIQARDGLDALITDVITCFENDGEIVAEAVAKLGEAVLALLLQFKIYSDDGILYYRFSKQWCDNFTPIIVRTNEEVV